MAARTAGLPAYLHQSGAVEELLAPDARPVVVTTGTGSGKTEAFLLPVIQNAVEDATRFRQNGLAQLQPEAQVYALHIGMCELYSLDGSELEFVHEGPWTVSAGPGNLGYVALTFVDPSLGGTGYLRRIAGELHLVAGRALEHLDHPGCETACYRCLKSYTNQRHHDRLQWPLAVPDLEPLAAAPPVPQPADVGDRDEPGPWLEAFAAGLGSSLELAFWRLFERHGFTPEKQYPITLPGMQRPLTIADFAVPERRLAIFVDGASIHVGANLRRDRYIRERLRALEPPWRVVTLRAADLSLGAGLVAALTDGK